MTEQLEEQQKAAEAVESASLASKQTLESRLVELLLELEEVKRTTESRAVEKTVEKIAVESSMSQLRLEVDELRAQVQDLCYLKEELETDKELLRVALEKAGGDCNDALKSSPRSSRSSTPNSAFKPSPQDVSQTRYLIAAYIINKIILIILLYTTLPLGSLAVLGAAATLW
jgi:chromosome segregation ATPase